MVSLLFILQSQLNFGAVKKRKWQLRSIEAGWIYGRHFTYPFPEIQNPELKDALENPSGQEACDDFRKLKKLLRTLNGPSQESGCLLCMENAHTLSAS